VADTPTVVRVHDVSKRFVIYKDKSLKERIVNRGRSKRHRDDFWALRNVDLEIGAGTTVGLIGPNGSGKSTLLKTIGGILQPTSGTVERRGRLAALLELGAGFHPDLTGRENVYLNASILGLSQAQTDHYFDAIVDFSGIERFIDTQVKFYSSGMYVRLAFAVAVHVDPDVLLVDEVLAVGDEPFQRKCLDRIRSFQKEGRTIVLVTHALDQVVDLCDRAVVLEAGRVVVDGDPALATRTLRNDFEAVRLAEQEVSAAGHPSQQATITGVRVLNADGTPASEILSGDDVRIQIDVEAPSALEDWVLGIGLDTLSGQNVYGTNTQLLGTKLPALNGRGTYEIRLSNLFLGAGQYQVHGALAVWAGAEIHRLDQAATVSVKSDGRSVGLLGADPVLVTG
jgi:ABC-2 type transport system ATP-binding protein